MPHYLPRPLPVFALQYTGDNAEEIKAAFPTEKYSYEQQGFMHILADNKHYCWINDGDYILRDHKGNISVMSKEEFEESYQKRINTVVL